MVWNVMQFTDERIPKKMQHTKLEGKQPRGIPRTRRIDQIRKDIEMIGEKYEKKYNKTGSGRIEIEMSL